VTDTGNKRIVVFDSNGQFLSQFGAAGMNLGELDEPVGIAVDVDGKVYVADTWNQRIQIFSLVPETDTFVPVRSIEFYGWFGQSMDNKPYLAVDAKGNVFVCDPEGMRVVEFDAQGIFVRAWGEFQNSGDGLSMPSGAAADSLGRVWITDAGSGRVMRFTMP
jgi:DNA-binding beta-propeller fold protein YncE